MSRYEELKKNRKSQTQEEEKQEPVENSRYQSIKANRGERNYGVDNNYINKFIQDANNFFTSSQKDYSSLTWESATDKAKSQSRNDTMADLSSRSATIRAFLNANKNNLDEATYNDLVSALDNVDSGRKSVFHSFRNAEQTYSQYESADHYFRAATDSASRKKRQDWWKESETKLKTLEEINKEYTQLTNTANSSAPAYANGRYSPGHNSRNPGGQNRVTPVGYTGADNEYSKQAAELLKKNGFGSIDELRAEIEELNAKRTQYERGEGGFGATRTLDDYHLAHMGDDAFLEASTYRDYGNASVEELMRYKDLNDADTWTYDVDGTIRSADGTIIRDDGKGGYYNPDAIGMNTVNDKLGLYLSATEEEKQMALGTSMGTWRDIYAEGSTKHWDLLTEDEVTLYYGLRKTQGEAAADKFLEDIQLTLDQRATYGYNERDAKRYEDANFLEKILLSAATVPKQLESNVFGFVEDTIATIRGEDINPYSAAHGGMHYSQTIRSERAKELDATGLKIPVVNFTLGDLYQSGMSTFDSLAAMGVAGPYGSVLLGMGAAENEAYRLYQEGASNEQIAWGAGLAGATELIFEKISLGELDKIKNIKSPKTLGQFFKVLLVQGGVEASEEMATEIANTIANAFIMGSQSDWEQLMRDSGGDLKKALGQKTLDVIHSGLSGFFSGAGSATTVGMASYHQNLSAFKNAGGKIVDAGSVDALKTLAMEVSGGKGAIARQANKVKSGSDSWQNRVNVGRLYQNVSENTSDMNRSDIQKALEDNGIAKKDAKAIADAMVAKFSGLDLTTEQSKLLENLKDNAAVKAVEENIVSNMDSDMSKRRQQMREFSANYAIGMLKKGLAKSEDEEGFTPEGVYEVSTDGKTLDKDGNEVNIVGIESTADGKLILKTKDGTIDAKNVSFATEADALIYEAVAKLGASPASAWTMIKSFKESDGLSAQEYAQGITLAYKYGKLNYKNGLVSLPNQSVVAFQKGREDAEASVKPTAQASTESTLSEKNADKKIIFEGFTEKEQRAIKPTQKASMAAIDMVNKVTNLEVHVYKSYKKDGKLYAVVNGKERSAPNGYFTDGNKIYIDINAGNMGNGLMLFTLSHEVGHYIAKWNAQDFKAISDFLFEHYGENVPILAMLKYQKDKLKASYKEDGKPIPSEAQLDKEAQEELVCEMLSRMMADKYAYDKLMELKQKDLKLHQKLGQAIKKVLDKIAKAIGIYDTQSPDFMYAASKENFGEEAFRQLQDLYIKAFVQADANFQTAEKNTTDDGGVLYLARDKKNNVVVDEDVDPQALRMKLTEIYNGNYQSDNNYFPVLKNTPWVYRHYCRLDADRSFVMAKKKAYKAMQQKNKKQHALGVDGLMYVIENLGTPNYIVYQNVGEYAGNYAAIIISEEREIFAAVQLGEYKDALYAPNGEKGFYNTLITAFYPNDGYIDNNILIPENDVVFDIEEDPLQVASGVTPSDRAEESSNEKVPQTEPVVKSELEKSGIGFDEETKTVFALRDSTAYKDILTVGRKKFDTEAIAQLVAKGTGRSIEDARKWVNSELSIANLIMANPEFLDFEPDDRYDAIKKNSDYPQGTVDLSNLCPKREEFTAMFDMLQKKYPNKLFTAQDIADMRKILSNAKLTVACGACFVEDRRQLVGEIADTYINMWKEAVETGKPLQKTNAAGQKVELLVTKALAKQYGLTAGTKIMATDTYIPNQYDLTTYEGFKLLEKNHPTIAMGFNRYNNSRGQQSARLIEGRAEYKRQILGWTDAKVRTVNNNGGLRIFSFSDFEVVHLLDLVQVIIDCAAKGVKIQGYTKIPAFAKLVRDTGIKLNRSHIPLGDLGYHMENGKVVLDCDTKEGIDTNDKNFLDEDDNPNVGDVIIGINPTQIAAAMLDPFFDYIIPFHSNKAKAILEKLGTGKWVNYKESQHEKDISTGTSSKHNVNIYTQVINKYHPTNKVEFVDAFLKECKKQGKIPRYAEFLNKEYKADGAYKDEGGSFDYTYREGYHKLLVDFKMFDKNGNILPQGNITPKLDEGFMKELLNAEIDKKQSYEFPQEVYAAIDEKFGEKPTMYSDRDNVPTFYSQMAKVVDAVKQEKLGAASVVSTLRGKGVKAEEIKWSGIEEWLDGKKSVTKAELLEFIAGSMLQIEEEVLDNKDRPYSEDQQKRLDEYEAKRDEVAKQLADEWKKITGEDFPIRNTGADLESAVVNKIIDANKEHKDAAFEGRLLKKLRKDLEEVIKNNDDFGFDSWKDALRSIHRHRRDFITHYEMSTNDKAIIAKYCNALNAYNELANKISDADTDKLRAIARETDPWNRKIMEVKNEHNEEEAKYMTNWGQYRLEGGRNYREMLFRIPGSTYTNESMMTHWKDRTGVLAHARVQDMDTFLGKMLFIEEIQSDWHNAGRKDGYRDPSLEDKHTLSKKMEKYTEEFFASPIADVVRERIGAIGYEGSGVSMILNFLLDSQESMESTLNTLSRKGASFTESEVSEIAKYAREYEEMYHKWETAPGDLTAPDAPFRDTYHEYVLKRLLREAAEQDYDSIGWTTAETQDDRWQNNMPHKEGTGKSGFLKAYTIEYDQNIRNFLDKFGKKWGTRVGKTTLDNGTEVWSMAITDSMKESVLTEGQALYQDRTEDSVSNRSLLANAFEGMAQNDIERNKIQEYKSKISLINAEEKKLRELNAQIKELSFAKGPKDTKKLKELRFDANQAANRINTYDKQLLRLEASQPLQDVLAREKKRAYSKAAQRGREALAEYKAKVEAQQKETAEKWRESRQKAVDNRRKSDVRSKIKAFKAKLEHSLLNPTDRQYVPIDLIKAMVDVCNLIDTDTDLYKADGSINKAQQKRDETKEKLQNLKDEYEKLKTHSDPIYAGEFDEMVYTYLTELRDKFSGKNLNDMSLDDLTEMYEILRAIDETLADARKLIGWGDAESVYEAGDAIVAEQRKITEGRKNGKRNFFGKANDSALNLSLSPVRNVERMAGYNGDSYLLKLFKKFEKGIRKKNMFAMNAYKSFENLTSGKEYEAAIYKAVGKEYTDIKGRKFHVSKMQMMQAILSFEREQANKNLHHIENGGFNFADLNMLSKGKLRDAVSEEYSHRVPAATGLVSEFVEALKDDKWCQDYMDASRKFFNGTAKEAINETTIILKHRIVAKDKNYIPFESDKNFVTMEISAENNIQQTINSYGMLKDTKDNAPQPLIITGLNNVIDRHIDMVGNVYGLAVEVRNFNKVWNVRSLDELGNDPTVKAAIQGNWGDGGVKHIEQAVKDIQGSRVRERSVLTAAYDKVKSGYIGATFLLNLSVVTKQIGSLFSATSMLRWRDPVSQLGNLFYTMANRKNISAEVDKYTATAWMRRQGVSDAELHTLMTEGKKSWWGRLWAKAPTVINPTKWITAMDHAVALSLWRYAKIDTAKKTGLKGEALLKATAEFYDDVIENTQSMTDVLHRPEIQKQNNILTESLAMFKTDLYQMAGQLHVTTGRFVANKSKENGKALGRTLYAVAMGAIWGQLMTAVFALLRYKVKPYRDEEDEELTTESWLKRQGFAFVGDIMGYIFPILGSETVGLFENIKYGESDDIVDSLALTLINDLYDSMITIGTSIKDRDMPDLADMRKITAKVLQVFGVPANNILRTWDAIELHAKDIANGEFFSFEAGVERTSKHHIHRVIEAMDEGKTDVAIGLFEEAVDELATKKADGGEYGDDEMKEAKSDLKSALGDKYKDGAVSKDLATKVLEELFEMDEDDIYWTFDKWEYAKENGSADDYAKYDDFFVAVETGKNLKATIKEYIDNGVATETLSKQITSHFKPLYIEMSKSEKANIKGYLLNAFEQCGMSRDKAADKIAEWEFEADHPELQDRISYSQYKRWQTDGKPMGISIELFTKVAEYRDDGTSSSVKSQDDVKAYIMSVTNDNGKRHALWCCFYKASTSPFK